MCDGAAGRCAGVGGRTKGARRENEGTKGESCGEKFEMMRWTIIGYGKPRDFIDVENRGGIVGEWV